MTKEEATQLMESFKQAGEALNEAASTITTIQNEIEKTNLTKQITDVITDIWSKLQSPLVEMYPDLDPDDSSDIESYKERFRQYIE